MSANVRAGKRSFFARRFATAVPFEMRATICNNLLPKSKDVFGLLSVSPGERTQLSAQVVH